MEAHERLWEAALRKRIGVLGWVSLLLIGAAAAPAIPLRCADQALRVGAVALGTGTLFGIGLAGITRTRIPILIYLCLGLVAAASWPLFAGWPPATAADVHPWPGAPELFFSYFDALRAWMFLVAIPYPFARLGYHAPDRPAVQTASEQPDSNE